MATSWIINLKFVSLIMSSLEDLVYEAYNLSLKEKLFKKVTKLRKKLDSKSQHYHLSDLYEKAWQKVLRKSKKKIND